MVGRGGGGTRRREKRCGGFEKKSVGFQLPGPRVLLGKARVGQGKTCPEVPGA